MSFGVPASPHGCRALGPEPPVRRPRDARYPASAALAGSSFVNQFRQPLAARQPPALMTTSRIPGPGRPRLVPRLGNEVRVNLVRGLDGPVTQPPGHVGDRHAAARPTRTRGADCAGGSPAALPRPARPGTAPGSWSHRRGTGSRCPALPLQRRRSRAPGRRGSHWPCAPSAGRTCCYPAAAQRRAAFPR
jgi:hypothetical protein